MTFRTWFRPAILGSAIGLIPLIGCFGSSEDKGDNSGPMGKPLPHDGTTRDDISKPRDNAGTITPASNKPGFGSTTPAETPAPSPAPQETAPPTPAPK